MPYRLPTPDLETQAHHIRSVRPSRLLVDSLWARTMRLLYTDPARAITLLERAREVARQTSYPTGFALCDIATALLAVEQGDTRRAHSLLDDVAQQASDDEHIRGWITLARAIDLHKQAQPEAALADAVRAYPDLALMGDMVGIGWSLRLMGVGYEAWHDYATALAYYEEQYQVLATLEDDHMSLPALLQVVETYHFLQRLEEAQPAIARGVSQSHALLAEEATDFARGMVARFDSYQELLNNAPAALPVPLANDTPFPDGAQRAALLPLQQAQVRAEREDEARRIEEQAFALEAVSEALTQHFARMKALRERNALTGLYHRGYLAETLPLLLERSHLTDRPLSLFLFDIDHFTDINTTYGYFRAEQILGRLGEVIARACPAPQLPIRYGGDRFVVVFPGYEGAAAYAHADALRTTIAQSAWDIAGVEVKALTISGGIVAHRDGETGDSLFSRADEALTHAKRAGRNRIVAVP